MIYVNGIPFIIFYNNYTINYNLRLLTTYCLCIVVAGEKKLPRVLWRVYGDVIFDHNMVHNAISMFNKINRLFPRTKGSEFISQWTSHGHHRNFNGRHIMGLVHHFFIVSIHSSYTYLLFIIGVRMYIQMHDFIYLVKNIFY